MRKMFHTMDRVADEAVEALRKLDPSSNTVDLKDFVGRYTIDVIAACCFALQPRSQEHKTNPYITASKGLFEMRVW